MSNNAPELPGWSIERLILEGRLQELRAIEQRALEQRAQQRRIIRQQHLEEEAEANKTRKKRKKSLVLERIEGEKGTEVKDEERPSSDIPRLPLRDAREMVEGKRGFRYTLPNGNVIPYCLPAPYPMRILCNCSRNMKMDDKARDHMLNCLTSRRELNGNKMPGEIDTSIATIDTNSDEYDDLRRKPQFFLTKCGLALRMHFKHKFVACICGEIKTIGSIQLRHKCHYEKLVSNVGRAPLEVITISNPRTGKKLRASTDEHND